MLSSILSSCYPPYYPQVILHIILRLSELVSLTLTVSCMLLFTLSSCYPPCIILRLSSILSSCYPPYYPNVYPLQLQYLACFYLLCPHVILHIILRLSELVSFTFTVYCMLLFTSSPCYPPVILDGILHVMAAAFIEGNNLWFILCITVWPFYLLLYCCCPSSW